MKQSLNLKLSQQLTLTPQLQQSLRLLQLSSLELEQEIQLVLEANPLLEQVEADTQEPESITDNSEPLTDSSVESATDSADLSMETDQFDQLAPEQDLSANWRDVFESNSRVDAGGHKTDHDAEFTQFVSKPESLFDHLSWQIQMTKLSASDKLIAQTLLHSLDDDGYLGIELHDVCQILAPGLEVEEDEVQAVLSLIKTLDPIGVGARNLSERLQILLTQIPDDAPGKALASTIVTHHLDLVGSHNTAKLKKTLNVTEAALTQSLALITRLNPRVASQFGSDNENHIVPDVIVKKVNETWQVTLNPRNQKHLRVNKTYTDLLNSNIDKHGSEFIQQHLAEAKSFIKGLMSRYDTLLLVSEAIVERQQGFFEHGEQAMQPMVLQDIAELLDMHESTISRATSGKYLLSPRGVVELKYFFSSALSTTDGAASSSTAVRSLIKKLIDAESKAKPLSDNKIAKELEKQGHIVARRTVAKYRESMHIAPSSQRKALV